MSQYSRWLADMSGYDSAETEVVKRVLRIVAQGSPKRVPLANNWRYGAGPVVRAIAPGSGAGTEYRPLPMPAVAAAARGEAPVARPVQAMPQPRSPSPGEPPTRRR